MHNIHVHVCEIDQDSLTYLVGNLSVSERQASFGGKVTQSPQAIQERFQLILRHATEQQMLDLLLTCLVTRHFEIWLMTTFTQPSTMIGYRSSGPKKNV